MQFYKMFLDEGVKAELSEYDALALIEWDVLVASDRSFEELYRAAFDNSEEFWVKGSNLEGTNFHAVAESSEMWHVMGHMNGNAIYNNNDPVFADYVEYTLARWEYKYPYDVALWATISDFPYSWPLWQRYSSKFVTTNLVRFSLYFFSYFLKLDTTINERRHPLSAKESESRCIYQTICHLICLHSCSTYVVSFICVCSSAVSLYPNGFLGRMLVASGV